MNGGYQSSPPKQIDLLSLPIGENKRLYFIGPRWLVERMKTVYGDSIDYYEQRKI